MVAQKSSLYSNVFEISAAIVTSFLARAFGSIPPRGLFCFSSLTASSIALILPGYIVCIADFGPADFSDGVFGVAIQKYCLWKCANALCSYCKSHLTCSNCVVLVYV